MSLLLGIFFFLLFLLLSSNISAKNREYEWRVEYMYWCPDGVEGVVMAINGHFPGPTIRATAGDTISVHLTNSLPTEGLVIHWHGISQHGTPWADGTASISQCPINPGETFLYKFKVDKAGTYFYHGHYGMQRSAGLYGSLIVEDEKEPFHYDGEFNLLLSDWWHKSSRDQQTDLSSKPFRWIGEPQIEGFTRWAINNISLVFPATPYLGSIKYGINNAFDTKSPPNTFSKNYDITKPPPNPNSTYGNSIYMLEFNTTIDIILQNANALAENVSEIHPWHLHGHNFWVLGYGDGKFIKRDVEKFNLKNPPLRNTVVLFPYGWTAIRFVADNPGVWPFHCHIEPHLHLGMGVVFAEGVHLVKNVPTEALTCGLTGKMLVKNKHK
ncbi:unnamed protein product [Withania somnifera]